ncbi:WD40-repeat-containing domain protein [Catenaria anguillulae PL171]|uniref:Eukaryotic translation initiation factor 3 subunit I n=1 Tax=Catenaria anguillulae PL171 TaxID=765915 RepID=A0A1Y2I0B2_9FUNG|nr:WD40-repeat-containing domain protein [Catenaria anguillulae PL171]
MRPIILGGHERPLTRVKYNRDGDLMFSAGKDARFNVWSTTDGELLGSYDGHSGVIYDFDVNPESTRLISGSADLTARLWDARTGKVLNKWDANSPVRSVAFVPKTADMAVIVTDKKMGQPCTAIIVEIKADASQIQEKPLSIFFPDVSLSPATIARWGPENTVYMGHENGTVSCWDALNGEVIASKKIHSGPVMDLQFSEDLTHFITASKDMSARILDLKLNLVKAYKTERPINSAAMCPIKEHIIVGGGQDASQVTTTSAKSGKFEARLFHKILGQEFARVKGHFGPINTIAVHPDGTGFTSGGEEGFIRLHHFDADYFKFKLDPRDP